MDDAKSSDENTRLYVIGDIHGRLDLLDRLIATIARDVEEHGPKAIVITLGDYIDRGADSPKADNCFLKHVEIARRSDFSVVNTANFVEYFGSVFINVARVRAVIEHEQPRLHLVRNCRKFLR